MPTSSFRFFTWSTAAAVFLLSIFYGNVNNQIYGQDDPVSESRLPSGRSIAPAGDIISFHGRPVDLRLSADGCWLFAKDRSDLRIIDVEKWELVQSVSSPDGASLWGLALGTDNTVYFTNSKSGINVFSPVSNEDPENGDEKKADAGPFKFLRTIELPKNSFPCGIKLSLDRTTAYVCLSKLNQVAFVDLAAGKVTRTVDVGVAPFDITVVGEQLLVSNTGGRRAIEGDKTAPSADTPTVVDERGIANTGSVSVIDLKSGEVQKEIMVGLQPSVMTTTPDPGRAIVCNTNDDSISALDIAQGKTTEFVVKAKSDLPFGSMPSAIHYLSGTDSYAVALAGNNGVAILDSEMKLLGVVPTAWYPVAVCSNTQHMFVACTKGVGSRADKRPVKKGRNSHDHQGAIQRIELTKLAERPQLEEWTKVVHQCNRIKQIIAANAPVSSDESVPPLPVPKRLGEVSVFKHVIYVVKENRTYDQVFGDIEGSRGEPELCVFPEKVTPNHHALATRFGVLDNYYCNGVLSADGHSWATEGNVTPYLERAFGGFARSYTFGDDPITYSSSGFLWDHVLAAGLSFRNYGEFDYAEPPAGMKYQEIWDAYQAGKPIEFKQKIGVDKVRRYSCRDYPGWNMLIPDVLRMDRFLKEFREFEKNGDLPNLTMIYLPQDHLGGGVTSEAHMADNDLALGRLVEAVSHSRYWEDTVIFVNEDDPQNGYDHIDGHRSICLVISPYSKPGINHHFYNQTSVLRTMLHIFGLPPMNQQDSSAPLMSDCFQAAANAAPYDVIDANFPLNQTPKPKEKQSALEKKWRSVLATVPIQRTGMKTPKDEDNLNRFVWHEVRGWETPYPDGWTGPHGKGLSELGLEIDLDSDE